MPKLQPIHVDLGMRLDTISTERLMRKYYPRSVAGRRLVHFDATKLEQADLFSLALLTLWIFRLRDQAAPVQFILSQPRSPTKRGSRLRPLLHRCPFVQAPRQNAAELLAPPARTDERGEISPSHRVIIGLHFFTGEDQLARFLTTFHTREPRLLGQHSRLDLISSGALRNVILRELLLNAL